MDKYFLKCKDDLEKVKKEFKSNQECINLIDAVVISYPCVLVSSYSDDIEFGDYYQFAAVALQDFK